jgi:endonuclease/exonuclease/phosphatase family metal-dependent hydrolase
MKKLLTRLAYQTYLAKSLTLLAPLVVGLCLLLGGSALLQAQTETIVIWDFTGQPGDQVSTAASATADNITGLDVTRSTGLTPSSAGGSISASNWNGTNDRYFSFGFVVASGKKVSLTSLSLATRASNTGPRDMALLYSGDNFTTPLATWQHSGTNFNNQTIDLSTLTDLTGTVTFRIVSVGTVSANGSTLSSAGTVRLTNNNISNNVSFIGTVSDDAGGGTPTPTLAVNPTSLAFGTVNINTNPTDLTYELTATNLTEDVTISVSTPFSISKDGGATFATSLSFTPAELSTAQTIRVRVATDNLGSFSETISHSTSGGVSRSLMVTATVFDPLNIVEDFNSSCPAGLPAGWSAVSVEGAQVWACTNFGRSPASPTASAASGLQINGFASGSAQFNEDWLITPAYDLSGFNIPILEFWSRVAFSGPRLRLLVSTDYISGNPNTATWTALSDRFATADVWTFSEGINLSDFKTAGVRIAFVYSSSAENGAARWTLDDFSLRSADVPPAPFLVTSIGNTDYTHFGKAAVGEVSSRTYTFTTRVENATDPLVILAVAGFEFSNDGTNFSTSLSIPANEAKNSQTITVRFKPTAEGAFSGPIVVQSGNLSQRGGFLTGSTIQKSETFDVVTWNIEWFGSNSNGPSDVDLQLQNVKTIIEDLDADVYAFQEITGLDKFYELADALPAYAGFHSTAVSGGSGGFASAQKVTFLYKTATVDTIRTQVLLKGTDVSTLPNYPGNDNSRFWASGRLPFMVEIDAKVGDEKKRMALINIHARSNGGGESTANPRYAMRKYDVDVLKDSLDTYFPDLPFIILGDYNDDLDETVADQSAATVNTSETSYIRYIQDTQRYKPVTISLSNAGLRSFIAFENVIDHMMMSNELFDEWLVNSERIVVPFDLVSNYQSTTSDHLPVKARFVLKTAAAITTKANQTISFSLGTDSLKTVGATPFQLTATATSGLPVSFTSNNPAVATISGNTVTIVGPGTTIITATQAGNERFNAAPSVSRSLTVSLPTTVTSLGELTQDNWLMYPNPVVTQLTLQVPAEWQQAANTVVVYNAQGVALQQQTIAANQANISLNFEALPTGAYYLIIRQGTKTSLQRILKQ